MRVLNFSLDKSIADSASLAGHRIAALSRAAGEVVALAPKGDNKLREFLRIWREANVLFRTQKFDLITVQDTAYLAFLAYLLARRFKIPLEVQVHGFERLHGVRKIIAGVVLRRADKIRVVSERLKRKLEALSPKLEGKIYELPVYTQIEPPLQGRTEKGLTFFPTQGQTLKSPTFTFLTVGRLVPVKNITLQIRVFARIAKEFPNARLVIVGDGLEMPYLKLNAKRLTLNASVIFEGRQENLKRYYQDADAFLLTSDSEGWGVAVTEAAAFGLPIIMTDVGLAGEFIKNNENGIVIPAGDEDALVSAMRRVMEDAGLRARLGAAARRSFLALPSKEEQIQKQVEQWRGLCRQIVIQ